MLKKTITIRNRTIGDNAPMMIIAEIACAHEGRFDDLLKLIDMSAETGADAVKFQVFDPQTHITKHHKNYPIARKLAFSPSQWLKAAQYAREKKSLLLLTDVYDEGSIDIVRSLDPDMVKIHSADLNNAPLLKKVAAFNKPTLIGIGASTVEEIKASLAVFRKNYQGEFIGLMHGYQAFPTKLDELNILQLPTFRNVFDLPVGFLDHTEGDTDESLYISLVARGVGAFSVERHIVLDRAHKGIDYESALSLAYFKKFVHWVRQTERALGNAEPQPLTEDEKKYREYMKKSIVAARDIKEGEVLDANMVAFKRSSPGLSGDQLERILGRTFKRSVNKDDNIVEEILK
jgi:sialic acid synthase SpsE